MFCTFCGNNIPDGSQFCPICGASFTNNQEWGPLPTNQSFDPMTPQSFSPDQSFDPMPPQPPQKNSGRGLVAAAVIMCVVALVAVVGVAAAVTNGFGLLAPETSDSAVTTGDSSDEAERDDERDDEKDDRAEREEPEKTEKTEKPDDSSPDQKGSATKPSTIAVSLNDPEDFLDINVALSNFTELAFDESAQSGVDSDKAFTRDTTDFVRIMTFYYDHVTKNGAKSYGLETLSSDDPLADNYFNRIPLESARSFIEERLGITLSNDQMTFDLNGADSGVVDSYRVRTLGDWLYFGIYDGSAEPSLGIANATSLTDLGNNRYRVTFDVYLPGSASGKNIMVTDVERSWYGLSGGELEAVSGADGVDRSGSAILEVHAGDGWSRFSLVEMDVSTPA